MIAGPERKTRAMSDKEKRVTAYHEAGHALTAWAMPNLDPVHKVTILPRGRSLGHTLVLPLEDRYTQTRAEILDQLVYALGGRAAEELVFHEPTTGASNDIEKATGLARAMVTEYGMSAKLGAVKYGTGGRRAVHGPRLRPPARLLRGHRRRHRRRGARPDRGARTTRRGRSWSSTATCSTRWCWSWSRRRRSTKDGSRADPRAGAQAAAAQHLRRVRQAHARATGRRSRSRRRCGRTAPTVRTGRPAGCGPSPGGRSHVPAAGRVRPTARAQPPAPPYGRGGQSPEPPYGGSPVPGRPYGVPQPPARPYGAPQPPPTRSRRPRPRRPHRPRRAAVRDRGERGRGDGSCAGRSTCLAPRPRCASC